MTQSKNNNQERVKTSRRNRARAPWADLPDDVLVWILMQLGFMDYFAFGGVCRSWRSVAIAYQDNFLAPQPPFIVTVSSRAKRACSLFNVFDRRRFKTMLPDLTGRTCFGLSCGFLLMLERSLKVWLVNLISREELHFPILPRFLRSIVISHLHAILVYSATISDYLLVIVYRKNKCILFCQSNGDNWAVYSYAHNLWDIVDLTVFKGKIYVLTSNARIGRLKLGRDPLLKLLEVSCTPTLSSSSLQLVTSNKRLFMVGFSMVDFCCLREAVIYELDFTRMEWVKIENLGEEALFLCDMKCSAVANPSKWGGRGNCIYILEPHLHFCCIISLDGRRLESAQAVDFAASGEPFVWYFPHQCVSTNLIHDGE